MALTQQEYDTYLAKTKELGITPNPQVKPIEAPIQPPQEEMVQPPTQEQPSFLQGLISDYGDVKAAMPPPLSTQVGQAISEGVEGTTLEGLSQQVKEVLPDIGEMGGAMTGMYYGAKTGSPYGVVGMGLLGTMLGSGSGESIKQMFNNEYDPLKTINTMLKSGIFEGGFVGVGKLFEKAGTAMSKLRADKDLSMDEIMSLDELVKGLESKGISLTPAQLTGSELQKTLEKVGKAGFGGEGKFADLYLAQDNFMADRLEALSKQVGNPSRKQAGDTVQQALEDADSNLMEWAAPKYAELAKIGKGQRLSMQGTLQSLRSKKAKSAQGRREGAKNLLDPKVEELYDYVLGNVQNTNFSQWFELMKSVNDMQRKELANVATPNPAMRKAFADVYALLYRDAERSAAKMGTDVLQKYKGVTSVVRESKRSLNESVIRTVAKSDPEWAGQMIYKNGNVTAVESAFKALDLAETNAKRVGKTFDAAQAKNDLRAGYLEQLLSKAELSETSAEMSSRLLERISRDPLAKDTFQAILTKPQQAQVKRVLAWGDALEKNSAGNFSLIVRGRQSGELNRLASEMSGNDNAGFAPTMVVKAIATLAAPAKLAGRAVNGKVTGEYLTQLKDTVVKFDKGDLRTSDMAALLGLWATSVTEKEEIPVEFRVPKMDSKQSIEYHAARARAIASYENAGIPVPEQLLQPPK